MADAIKSFNLKQQFTLLDHEHKIYHNLTVKNWSINRFGKKIQYYEKVQIRISLCLECQKGFGAAYLASDLTSTRSQLSSSTLALRSELDQPQRSSSKAQSPLLDDAT